MILLKYALHDDFPFFRTEKFSQSQKKLLQSTHVWNICVASVACCGLVLWFVFSRSYVIEGKENETVLPRQTMAHSHTMADEAEQSRSCVLSLRDRLKERAVLSSSQQHNRTSASPSEEAQVEDLVREAACANPFKLHDESLEVLQARGFEHALSGLSSSMANFSLHEFEAVNCDAGCPTASYRPVSASHASSRVPETHSRVQCIAGHTQADSPSLQVSVSPTNTTDGTSCLPHSEQKSGGQVSRSEHRGLPTQSETMSDCQQALEPAPSVLPLAERIRRQRQRANPPGHVTPASASGGASQSLLCKGESRSSTTMPRELSGSLSSTPANVRLTNLASTQVQQSSILFGSDSARSTPCHSVLHEYHVGRAAEGCVMAERWETCQVDTCSSGSNPADFPVSLGADSAAKDIDLQHQPVQSFVLESSSVTGDATQLLASLASSTPAATPTRHTQMLCHLAPVDSPMDAQSPGGGYCLPSLQSQDCCMSPSLRMSDSMAMEVDLLVSLANCTPR